MKILFARVGYMKFYKGPKPGDERPIGGGAYNADEIGAEAYNFLSINGNVYGYFQPHMHKPYEINLGRIEKGRSKDRIEDVLVVWFATNPIDRGQVVVGWYKNATIFQAVQVPTALPLRENYSYYIKARAKDCVLLPISKRTFPVGHTLKGTKEENPGQANAFYLFDQRGWAKDLRKPLNRWIADVIDYVGNYKGESISSREDELEEDVSTTVHSSGGQGFQSDVEARLRIESHAMDVCKAYYRKRGYKIKDVSAVESYDLILMKNGEKRFVEVKGIQTEASSIILTKNEVDLSRSNGGKMVLFIVHSTVMGRRAVKKGSGIVLVKDPWHVNDKNLTPLSYIYRVS